MDTLKFWLITAAALALLHGTLGVRAEIASADLPVEARSDGSSLEDDELISTSYVLPNQIFNDGKPYYASKDPISGQLDFSAKKPAGIETAANEVFDPKEKIVLSSSTPNIHDFLNLPVKYSSSKFVYPLVSSSYANLKYQGSNKNYITNKRPTSVVASVTPSPDHNYFTVPTTKLMAVQPTAPAQFPMSNSTSTSTSTSAATSTTTTTTTTTTSKKPSTTKTTSTTATSTSTATTAIPKSTKYASPSRKPIPLPTTATTHDANRKKFIPTKKYTTTTVAEAPSTPLHFPTERPLNTTTAPRPSSPKTTTQTSARPTTTSTKATSTTTRTTIGGGTTSTKQPVTFTENPSAQHTASPSNSPHPSIPNLDAGAVYQTLGHKNTEQHFEQKPSMSLADIFNSLAEEESALASHNQGGQGFDAKGNLMQPISPAKPSPFAMQHQQPQQRPPSTQPPGAPDQKLISGSQENYSGEYVSYQVQQPNVMQYRPIPGAINNVVISPGQHSASFVLGSQQQVGAGAFGAAQKEPLFAKEPPVQYGTVISEDINGGLQRPAPQPTNSNFHQNGNYASGAPTGPTPPYVQRPLGSVAPASLGYQEEVPAPPSPYQQLPQAGSHMRPRKPAFKQPLQQQQQQQQAAPPPPQVNYQQQQPQHQLPPQAASYQQQQQQQQQPPAQASYQQQLQQQQQQQQQQQPLPQASYQQQPMQQQQQEQQQQISQGALGATQDTKELLVSTNIRFPANDEERSDEVPSAPVGAGPPNSPQVNGHAQPLSLQQLQSTNPVVFPQGTDSENIPADNIQIQKHEVLTMNQHKQKLSFPASQQQAEQDAPSQHMEPPPRYPPTLANNLPEHAEMHKRPPPNRPPGPPSFAYKEYTRKPIPGITRPNPERHLPNILPQFRPNAKISAGHPPGTGNFNQEPGNIRLTGQPPKRPNPSPQFAHRRQPLMQQNRYPHNRIAEYPGGPPPPLPQGSTGVDANRRVYRLPPYGGQGIQYLDRMYPRRPSLPQRSVENYERHAATANAPQAVLAPERMAAFEEEDLVINDPPQPVTPSKDMQTVDKTKLEPVVTLQMLQSRKKPVTLVGDDNGSGEIQVPAGDDSDAQLEGSSKPNGLYVVYPMKGDGLNSADDSGDVNEALPAIAHIEPPSGSDYQNTPFSVVRDQPQEPILKNKKPQSLQQQTNAQMPRDKFPYAIEKPDPAYSELSAQAQGILIAPRIISSAGYGASQAPIAIAYSPTEPNPFRRTGLNTNADKYSNVNLASAVISEIRPDTQTEEGISNNDFDLRGQNLEKNFMAPFYPSISLGSVTSAPANGWNILPSTSTTTTTSTTEKAIYRKHNINRADVGDIQGEAAETTTVKNFEMDNFQPELQGGFKPIYPPGYKLNHDSEETLMTDENNEKPLALASYMRPAENENALAKSVPSSTTSTSSTTTTTTSTTPKPQTSTAKPPLPVTSSSSSTSSTSTTTAKPRIAPSAAPAQVTPAPTPTPPPRKKSTFETSLAALLFGEDEDFVEEERAEARKEAPTTQQQQQQTKANSGGPRSIPRMGPRSLTIS